METRDRLKIILKEWAEYHLPPLYPRDFDWELLKSPEILSVIGARRSGKTYLCFQMIQALKRSHPPGNVIYVNLEDERLYPLRGDELTLLWDICQEFFSLDLSRPVYLFIDEIQNVPHWSKWARRITDQNKNLKLIVTGSSAKVLGREIATELRGRNLNFPVFPFSFGEFLTARGVQVEDKDILYSPKRVLIKKNFNDYFRLGGFPAVLNSNRPQELLKEYYSVMFYRDLIERHSVANIKLLEDYLTLLIDQVGCDFSISSTAKKLNGFGYSLSKNTLTNFFKYAQDAFLAFEVKKYSYKIKEQMRAPKKVYTIDHGLLQAVRFMFAEDYGRIMENMVYIALRRRKQDIYYYKGEKSCDFVTRDRGKVIQVIQVAKTIQNLQTKKREVEGLIKAMSLFKLKKGVILTEDEYEEVVYDGFRVQILPLWYWLLRSTLNQNSV